MMKKKIIFFLIFLFFVKVVYCWEISDFKVDIEINSDASIEVVEEITADFSDIPKHGIFRNIPIRYIDERGRPLNFNLKILGIYDENNNPWQYTENYDGNYLKLKIGSPYKTYQEKKTFVIKYKVIGAILFLENHDQLYWNAIGTEWDAPINNVLINVSLPKPVNKDLLMATSYSGRYGLRSSNLSTEIIDDKKVVFRGGRYLPYEGVTVVVGWPKGIVEEKVISYKNNYYTASSQKYDYGLNYNYDYIPNYSSYKSYSKINLPNIFYFFIPLIIPTIVFIIMFNLWKKYGKDPKLEKSIVVEYKAPEGISPLEMGTLIDDKVDIRDISATIIDLAIRGYFRIVQTEGFLFKKNYAFEKLKDYEQDNSLAPFEKIILDTLFKKTDSWLNKKFLIPDTLFGGSFNPSMQSFVELSSLENNFYTSLNKLKDAVFSQLIKKGFYSCNPEKVVLFYRSIGISFLVMGIFLMVFFGAFLAVLSLIGLGMLLGGIIILIFAKYMPAKTKKGMEVYGKILGFEEFLRRTDKDKIQISERQNIFEKMLPYAICLGISNQWTRAFADLYSSPPNWFLMSRMDRFSMESFITNLNHSITLMNSTFISAPRTVSSSGGFSGGGFSGGGFGGGGGSSW